MEAETETEKKEIKKTVQTKLAFKPIIKKTQVINVKVKFLREMGYENF